MELPFAVLDLLQQFGTQAIDQIGYHDSLGQHKTPSLVRLSPTLSSE